MMKLIRKRKNSLLFYGLISLFILLAAPVQAQQYFNGNLSTGATSQSGVAAPAGYTWCEAQNNAGNLAESNTVGGFAGSVSSGMALADDFTVPAGPNWTVTKFTFYAYQTNAAASPSPFTTLRFRIYNGNPSAGSPTIVFGDLTTNRLTASNDAFMYRIFNTVAPAPGTATGTTRKIWTLEADVNISLAPGTYWVEWQTDNSGGTAHFAPPSTVPGVRTVAGYNAQQHDLTANTWTNLIDGGNPASAPDVAMDMPFIIDYYSSSACSNISPTINLSGLGCTGSPLTLTSDTIIAQVDWYLNGNLISTEQGWDTNAITIAGGVNPGNASNQLNSPYAIYIDSINNVYVADMENHRIQKFTQGSSIGTTVAGGNGAGSSPLQLNKPTGVYLDKQGYIYVTDFNNHRVQKFPPNSTSTTPGVTVAGGNGPGSTSIMLNNPMGLCIDTLNYLYVSDAANNRIQRFPPNSTNTTPGVTVAGGNGAGGALNQISNPFHVFVDDSLSVYVADWGNGRIQKWKNGFSTGTTVATNLIYPSGVFVDKKYNIYVSDQNNNQILKFKNNPISGQLIAGGNGQGTASNQISLPGPLFFDKTGNLYVPDNRWNIANRIQKFSLRNNFTFTPTASGTYTAMITLFNGCTFASNSINVNQSPSATITYSGSPYCRTLTSAQPVTRTGTAGGTYSSTPAGLSLNSSTGAITPSLSTVGTYTVSYTIPASNGCQGFTTSASVSIIAQPSATISYNGSPYCRTLTTAQPVTRTGTAGGTYSSSPAGLSINSSTGSITPSLSTAGTYTVVYTIPASSGCQAFTTSASVTITSQPSATISYNGSPYCRTLTTAQPVTRTGTAGGTYSSTPAGLSLNSSTGAITPSLSTAGTYTVVYTIPASSGCQAFTTSASVIITSQPSATISYSGSPYCRTLTTAQPVTRTGTAGGTYSSSPAGLSLNSSTGAITPSLSIAGTYTVTYSVAASGGCGIANFTSAPVVISSTLPVGNITPATGNICEGSTLTLSTSGGNTYQWFKNGSIITGATNSTYQASTSGTYTVQIFSSNGCNAMGGNSSVLTFTKKPVADFSYNSYCINRPITFNSTSDTMNSRPVTYIWTFGDGAGISTVRIPSHTYMNPGTYNVTLSVRPTLCPSLQSAITKTITIDSFIPNLRYPNVNAVVPPGIQLNAREFVPAANYSWSPSAGLSSTNLPNPYFNTSTPQKYIITIRNNAGCVIKDTLQVNVFTTQDIFVPKGFSPNNDGANDKLFPFLVGIRTLNYFQVYNRWGQKVFETNTEGAGWDGKYQGVSQPIETYTWIAEGIGLDGKIVKRSGGTLLMR